MKKGFTFIELLVVVLIVGILAAIAVPQYEYAVEKARAAEALTVLKKLADNQRLCILAKGGVTDCQKNMELFEGYENLPIEDAKGFARESKHFRYSLHGVLEGYSKEGGYALFVRIPQADEYIGIPVGRYCAGETEKGVAFCKKRSNDAAPFGGVYFPL